MQFGFSHADADRLRKIMSKKDKELQLKDYRHKFFQAAAKQGVDGPTTERIWAMMMSFSGYSFCKPHSASYARVSFQAAYLKAHFPAEFMASVLSNQGGFYSSFAYVSEARRLGLTIVRPDVTSGTIHWQGKEKQLQVGLMAITGLSSATCKRIAQEVHERPFISMFDFLGRIQPSTGETEALIHAGALDSLHKAAADNRGILIWLLAAWKKSSRQKGSLFPVDPTPPQLPAEDPRQRLRNEYRVLGFLCGQHPITLFAEIRRKAGALTAHQLLHLPDQAMQQRRKLRFLGWLITGKIVGTKAGEPMEFLSFEDETDIMECTLFAREYQKYCHLLHRKGPLMLEGYLEMDFGVRTFTISQINVAR